MVRKSILLIDDDKLVLDTIAHLLETSGHLVRAFQNPLDAVQESMMEDFDLVITDIRMPHISGFQAIRYIREVRREQGKAKTPEIFITGYAKDYEEEAKQFNPHAVIYKPFHLEEFINIVNDALFEKSDQI